MRKQQGERRPAQQMILTPGLAQAPVLDRMCTHFVLTLTTGSAGRFNLRRDWNSLLALTAKHLVWPESVLSRVREFLGRRVRGVPSWDGHAALADAAFLERFG